MKRNEAQSIYEMRETIFRIINKSHRSGPTWLRRRQKKYTKNKFLEYDLYKLYIQYLLGAMSNSPRNSQNIFRSSIPEVCNAKFPIKSSALAKLQQQAWTL